MITYPVNPESKWSFYDTDANAIVKKNVAWPTADLMEIPGLADNIVPLEQKTLPRPSDDPRVNNITPNEVIDAPNNELRREWLVSDKSADQIKLAVLEIERDKLEETVGDLEQELVRSRLAIAAILQYPDLTQAPARVKNFLMAYKTEGAEIWKRRTRREALEADIDAGNPVDIDAGWDD